MHIGEEEASLSQPVTTAVPLDEEDVPVTHGLHQLPLERPPPVTVPPEEEEVLASLVTVPSEGRGCLVPVPPLVSSLPFFFLKNAGHSSHPFFS
jgi:hypothetical protein